LNYWPWVWSLIQLPVAVTHSPAEISGGMVNQCDPVLTRSEPDRTTLLKALLRKAAERTIPRLLRKIRSLLRTVSADECLNFFRHSGYASN
jgi:hypothetical protein